MCERNNRAWRQFRLSSSVRRRPVWQSHINTSRIDLEREVLSETRVVGVRQKSPPCLPRGVLGGFYHHLILVVLFWHWHQNLVYLSGGGRLKQKRVLSPRILHQELVVVVVMDPWSIYTIMSPGWIVLTWSLRPWLHTKLFERSTKITVVSNSWWLDPISCRRKMTQRQKYVQRYFLYSFLCARDRSFSCIR